MASTRPAALLYAPTCGYDFTHLDDDRLILGDPTSRSTLGSLPDLLLRPYFGVDSASYYRPLVNLSLAIDRTWSGEAPFGYHLTNVALHVACCWLVFRLLGRLGLGSREAGFGALVFATHPVAVASVAWIPGRNDLLLTLFGVAAALCLLQDRARPSVAAKLAHLACYGLALLAKEVALCLPLLFASLSLARGMGDDAAPSREAGAAVPRRWLEPWALAGWAALVAGYVLLRTSVVGSPSPLLEAVVTSIRRWPVPLADLGKLVLPARLQVLAAPEDVPSWLALPALVLLVAVVWGLPAMRRGVTRLALGVIALTLVTSGAGASVVVLENRLYFALVGWALLLGEALRACRAAWPHRAWLLDLAAVTLILALGGQTLVVSGRYRDRHHFARAAIVASPRSGLAVNLLRRASRAGSPGAGY